MRTGSTTIKALWKWVVEKKVGRPLMATWSLDSWNLDFCQDFVTFLRVTNVWFWKFGREKRMGDRWMDLWTHNKVTCKWIRFLGALKTICWTIEKKKEKKNTVWWSLNLSGKYEIRAQIIMHRIDYDFFFLLFEARHTLASRLVLEWLVFMDNIVINFYI